MKENLDLVLAFVILVVLVTIAGIKGKRWLAY